MSQPEAPKIDFPCDYVIKVIGKAAPDFTDFVISVVEHHAPGIRDEHVSVTASRNGRFTSVSLTIVATGEPQLKALFEESIPDALATRDGLVGLAVGQDHVVGGQARQRRLDGPQVQWRYSLVGYDQGLVTRNPFAQRLSPGERPRADFDAVAARTQGDVYVTGVLVSHRWIPLRPPSGLRGYHARSGQWSFDPC